ncbi:hypothetical protein DRP04_03180, partial [Archaeoglobales archaeon]
MPQYEEPLIEVIENVKREMTSIQERIKGYHFGFRELNQKREEFEEYIEFIAKRTEKLKAVRPNDCSEEEYSSFTEIVKPHLNYYEEKIKAANSVVDRLQESTNFLSGIKKRINKIAGILKLLESLSEEHLREDLRALRQKFQDIEGDFEAKDQECRELTKSINDACERL